MRRSVRRCDDASVEQNSSMGKNTTEITRVSLTYSRHDKLEIEIKLELRLSNFLIAKFISELLHRG